MTQSSKPTVAVLLGVYNGTKWLDEQMTTILEQSDVSVTVFVSVDCSTDGSEQWIDRMAATDVRVKVLPQGYSFGGAARNFFRLLRDVDFREFDYVSFADQDDIWLPKKLSQAHEMLVRTKSDGYSSNVLAFWADGPKTLIEKSQPQVKWDFLFEAAGPGCSYVMRKELACALQDVVISRWDEIQEVGLHDWFAYAFSRANGYRWVIDDVPRMLYRQHENNQVGVNIGWRAFFHRADKVLSGWGLAQSALIARLVGIKDYPFVLRWVGGSRLGLIYLALHAVQCRRRVRDKFIFGLSCLVLSVTRRSRR
jgi:rhamnosyltransferase